MGDNMKSIREITQESELLNLCKDASFSAKTLGRKVYEEPCSVRTEYQRDRDRILHSKSFRRLKHKTQVFISPIGDHYRTRLTHTLEVSQIARTVARALKLNEDLTEAIALGHDLGHTPFGHAGEKVLNDLCEGGFYHYVQSIRVVEKIEKNGKGLNLTREVLDGILNHTKGEKPFTAEGKLVRICDKVAYINHDIEDAVRAGLLKLNSLPRNFTNIFGNKYSERINSMVLALINNSKGSDISMGEELTEIFKEIHKFMYNNVYLDKKSVSEEEKVPFVIVSLFNYFKDNVDKMPLYIKQVAENEGKDRAICDYIAGMTDTFATNLFKDIFIPKSSKVF